MAHAHSIYDTDTHFSINPTTREIVNQSGETTLIQNDHNSERFTFEIPKEVDGHDMSLCNSVQIHFHNIDRSTKQKISGVYEVDDLQISPDSDDIVICSWLISASATQYVGALNFVIRFACVADDGTIDYAWNTAVFSGITVSEGIYNGDDIVEQYADVLETWKQEFMKQSISQPDWNAAAGEGGHVLNRTHYSEYAKEVYLAETTLTQSDGAFIAMGTDNFVAGETYSVIYNGTEYISSVFDYGEMVSMGTSMLAIGNPAIMATDLADADNGLPFAMMYVADMGGTMIMTNDGLSEITVGIIRNSETAHKLPEKYLPDIAIPFWIYVACNDDGTYTTDVTWEQAMAGFNAGRMLYAKVEHDAVSGIFHTLPLSHVGVTTIGIIELGFFGITTGTLYEVIMSKNADGGLDCMYGEATLSINS